MDVLIVKNTIYEIINARKIFAAAGKDSSENIGAARKAEIILRKTNNKRIKSPTRILVI